MKIMIVFGTRPEAIKLCPLIHLLKDKVDVKVLSSGQHIELTNQAIDFLGIKLDYNLFCMSEKPDLETVFETIIRTMKVVMYKENPDLVIVQGDTLTAFSGAFLGFMTKKPVLHIEAGLRTFNKFSPFPEEMLRILISRLASFHFAPTERAAANLIAEGIRKDRIHVTGNTVVDALLFARDRINEDTVLAELSKNNSEIKKKMQNRKLILITSHRRENIGLPLKKICRAVKKLAEKYNDALFLWSLHKNPDVRKIIFKEIHEDLDNLVLAESFSYQTMVYLLMKSHIILTDSGGIQEEAPTFKKPLIVLRDTTERQETIESGIGFLVGSNEQKIMDVFTSLYEDNKFYDKVTNISNPFGDGRASERIVQFLMRDDVKQFIKNYSSTPEENLNVRGMVNV
jgi:UDP-N-acetylglucosamine 2-epimerase (non-hydrolysing)